MIYLFGDVHGHFAHVIDIVRRERPDAIIFLGDLECQRPLHELVAPIRDLTEIWFIHGNHDTDSDENYKNLFESELADHNLHGKIRVIAGLRVAGLGGVFRGDIWYPPDDPSYLDYNKYRKSDKSGRYRLSKRDLCQLQSVPGPQVDLQDQAREGRYRKHLSSIFYADYFRLYGAGEADILVTHEAPTCHSHGFREIDSLAQSLHVKFAFHGHHHDSLNYRGHDKRLGFQAFGIGFCGVTDMYGGIIAPGDFDEARRYRMQHVEEIHQNGMFVLEIRVSRLTILGEDSQLDIDLSNTLQDAAATQTLKFLSPYRRVSICADSEAAEAQFLALLGTRAPAHISFSRPTEDNK